MRKKHKGNRKAYEEAKNQLRHKVGHSYFENIEICIRQNTALKSKAPVFERLWLFWCNHFAIIEKTKCHNSPLVPIITIRTNIVVHLKHF